MKKRVLATSFALLSVFFTFVLTSCSEEQKSATGYYAAQYYNSGPAYGVNPEIVKAITDYQKKQGIINTVFAETIEGTADLTDEAIARLDAMAVADFKNRLKIDYAKVVKDAGIIIPGDQGNLTITYSVGWCQSPTVAKIEKEIHTEVLTLTPAQLR